jgi:hypothetical protein
MHVSDCFVQSVFLHLSSKTVVSNVVDDFHEVVPDEASKQLALETSHSENLVNDNALQDLISFVLDKFVLKQGCENAWLRLVLDCKLLLFSVPCCDVCTQHSLWGFQVQVSVLIMAAWIEWCAKILVVVQVVLILELSVED